MLSTTRIIKGLACRDIYFAPQADAPAQGEDLQLFLQVARQSPGCEPFVTSIVHLANDESTIAAGFKKSTAYDVKRAAEKDLVEVVVFDFPSAAQIEEFSDFFDVFAVSKGIGGSNRRKLRLLAEAGALAIAIVRKTGTENVLAAHTYIVGEGRARLLYSGSYTGMVAPAERQVIGRANKYMHWQMLLHFKKQGLDLYDFGGLSKREELKSIDEFKLSFGGSEIVEFNCVRGVTWKGKAAVWLLRNARLARGLLEKLKKKS